MKKQITILVISCAVCWFCFAACTPQYASVTEGSGPPVRGTAQQGRDFNQAHQLRLAADTALSAGDYATTEADARQSIALYSHDGFALEDLASALYSEGKMPEALQEYKKLTANGVYTAPYALLLLESGQWAQAVGVYDKLATDGGDFKLLGADSEFSPNVPQPIQLKAAILIHWAIAADGGNIHGTYDERNQQAQPMFEEAAKLVPDSAVAQYYIAYGLRRLNRRAEAKAAFAKAASMGNSDVKACVDAGSVDGGMSRVKTGR